MSSSEFHEFIDLSSSSKKGEIYSSLTNSKLSLQDLGLHANALSYAQTNSLTFTPAINQAISWTLLGETSFVVDPDFNKIKQSLYVSMLHILSKKELKPVIIFGSHSGLEEFQEILNKSGLPTDCLFSVDSNWEEALDKDSHIYFVLPTKDIEQQKKINSTLFDNSRQVNALSFVLSEDSNDLKETYTALNRKVKFFYSQPQHVEAEFIDHQSFNCSANKKYKFLVKLIEDSEGIFKVFLNSKYDVDDLANKLKNDKAVSAKVNSWNFRPKVSDKVFLLKKKSEKTVLVGTEKSLGDLFVNEKVTVVNFDLPTSSESYIDRIAPTYTVGSKNSVVSLACEDHGVNIASINRDLDESLHILSTEKVSDEYIDPDFRKKTKDEYKKEAAKDREARNASRDARSGRGPRPDRGGSSSEVRRPDDSRRSEVKRPQERVVNNREPLFTNSASNRNDSKGGRKGSSSGQSSKSYSKKHRDSRNYKSSSHKKGDISSVGQIHLDPSSQTEPSRTKSLTPKSAAKARKGGFWSKFKGALGIK